MDFIQIFSIVIFIAVMACIVSDKLHRTLAALLGAIVVLVSGILPFEECLQYIDFNTLGVLIGMMLFVSVIKHSGFFEYISIKAARFAKGDPWKIMVALVVITAVASAFLDNVTTVILICPMTLMICRELKLDPAPFFITQIIASNIGGTATLIGDPPNIMISSPAGFSFLDFIIIDAPIAVIVLVATIVCFRFFFMKKLIVLPENVTDFSHLNANEAIKSKSLFIKSIVMFLLVTVAFMLHSILHLETSLIALSAAGIMMLLGRQSVEKSIHDVEWTTIGFFIGLFIIVGAMAHTGVIDMFADFLVNATGGNLIVTMLAILVASAILSAIIDNIPFVATMIPVLLTMQASGIDVVPLWWALSLGACFGGNGTLIGASANVILSGICNREGYCLTFNQFLKYGLPIMLLSIVLSGVYLFLIFGI